MRNSEQIVKDLISKNEKAAQEAAFELVNNTDVEAFRLLVEKSDYLFDFVKDNVAKRLQKAITPQNYRNIFYFLSEYSPDYDEILVSILAKYADEDLTDTLYDLLLNGDDNQKTYAAKYFSYIPDTIAAEILEELACSDNESLAYNSAQALAAMGNKDIYKKFIDKLSSKDEFEQLKAVKFCIAYGDKSAFEHIYNAMLDSAMTENIAAEIPYLVPLNELLNSPNKEKGLVVLSEILAAIPEIVPLSVIVDFQFYEVFEYLIKSPAESGTAVVLLEALSKFKMLNGADEYIYSEDKNTKNELCELYNLLDSLSEEFWQEQKSKVADELSKSQAQIIVALEIIKEYNLQEHAQKVVTLAISSTDTIKAYAVSTLKSLNALSLLNKDDILKTIKDTNIKAIIENCYM